MEKKLLFGVLTKTLNKSEQEMTDLLYQKADDSDEIVLKEGALEEILALDVQRVKTIQAGVKPDEKILKDQYSRGKKEALEGIEKEVRGKYSLESDKTGIELISEAVDSQKKQKPEKLTDDEVKKHPVYLELENNSIRKEEHEKVKTEFDDFKKNQEKSERMVKIHEYVLKELDLLNPVLSENSEVKMNRQRDFLAKFDQWDYQLNDGSDPLILQNGNRLEDAHGNPVAWKDFVKQKASLHYDFKAQNDKGNAGNDDKGKKFTGDIKIPANKEEYSQMIFNETDPDRKIAIKEAAKAAGIID